jgi:hypothetical protein
MESSCELNALICNADRVYLAASCSRERLKFRSQARGLVCMGKCNSNLRYVVSDYIDTGCVVIARYSGHACD